MIINKLKNILNIKIRIFTTVVEVLGMLITTVIVCAMLIVIAEVSIAVNEKNIDNDNNKVVAITKAEDNIIHNRFQEQLNKMKEIDVSTLSEKDKNEFRDKIKNIEDLINIRDYNRVKRELLDLLKEKNKRRSD